MKYSLTFYFFPLKFFIWVVMKKCFSKEEEEEEEWRTFTNENKHEMQRILTHHSTFFLTSHKNQ